MLYKLPGNYRPIKCCRSPATVGDRRTERQKQCGWLLPFFS